MPTLANQLLNNLLRLTTTEVSRKYRQHNDGKDGLNIKLKLRFTNIGNQPIILNKRDILLTETFIVPKDERDEYLYGSILACNLVAYDENRFKQLAGSRPNSLFAVLSPGESFETQDEVFARVTRGDAPRESNALSAGEYFLIVSVSTWDGGEQDLAEKLRRKWQRFGYLWSNSIKSEAMPLVIEKERVYAK